MRQRTYLVIGTSEPTITPISINSLIRQITFLNGISLKPGMVLCVEAYIGKEDGLEGVKLENQILVTNTGFKNLTTYPYDNRLMGS